MNTISNSMVQMTTDGQTLYGQNTTKISGSASSKVQAVQQQITPTAAQVAQTLERSLAEMKAESKALNSRVTSAEE